MTNLIDKTYFVGDLLIPNVATDTDISGLLDLCIAKYQEKILIDLLGYDLYLAFEIGLTAPVAQKWLDLRDGKTYTVDYNGETFSIKWKGLKNTALESLLAYFVHFYFCRDQHISITGTGAVVNAVENSTVVMPNQKIIQSYNKGVEIYGNPLRLKQYRNDEVYVYNSDFPVFQNYGRDDLKATAYNFIQRANDLVPDTYPKWVFTKKSFINNFGF